MVYCGVPLMSYLETEIPRVSVSKPRGVLRYGDEITIVCNVTECDDSTTALTRQSWYKDGYLIQSVRNPNPRRPRDFLDPLDIRYGGNYTCLLEVLLRRVKKHKVSDSTVIRSEFHVLLGG